MRYVALLRAVNVGGRVVKMEDLRRLFSSMGFSGVQTFIASGNVIFESAARSVPRLETSIEQGLERGLGLAVETFVRTAPQIAHLARHPVVSGAQAPDGCSIYVMFLRGEPLKDTAARVTALGNGTDRFEVHGSHVIWTVKGKLLDSTVPGRVLGKTIGMSATVRNVTTVRRLAAKYCSWEG